MLGLSGCAGAFPEVPYDQYVKAQATHLPGDGVRANASIAGVSGGVEVTEENGYNEESVVITPFLGTKSPAYNQGRRDAKRQLRSMKQSAEISQAVEKGLVDGLRGVFEPTGFNLKYLFEYEEAFESSRLRNSQQEDSRRRELEYRQGWDAYMREKGVQP